MLWGFVYRVYICSGSSSTLCLGIGVQILSGGATNWPQPYLYSHCSYQSVRPCACPAPTAVDLSLWRICTASALGRLPEVLVISILGQQLCVSALLQHPPAVDSGNLGAAHDGGQAVGNHNRGAADLQGAAGGRQVGGGVPRPSGCAYACARCQNDALPVDPASPSFPQWRASMGAHHDFIKRRLHQPLRLAVERRGGLIQQQDLQPGAARPCRREAFRLA